MLLQWEGQETAWIEIALNHSMQLSDNMNDRFVTLNWRCDKPLVNRKVRCVNVRIDWAVLWVARHKCHAFETTSF